MWSGAVQIMGLLGAPIAKRPEMALLNHQVRGAARRRTPPSRWWSHCPTGARTPRLGRCRRIRPIPTSARSPPSLPTGPTMQDIHQVRSSVTRMATPERSEFSTPKCSAPEWRSAFFPGKPESGRSHHECRVDCQRVSPTVKRAPCDETGPHLGLFGGDQVGVDRIGIGIGSWWYDGVQPAPQRLGGSWCSRPEALPGPNFTSGGKIRGQFLSSEDRMRLVFHDHT